MIKEIHIRGRVQGVGFRPFIHGLARDLGLSGTVSNDCRGVLIRVKGEDTKIQRFLTAIPEQKPTIAEISSIDIRELPDGLPQGDFRIIPTTAGQHVDLPLTPDFAICQSCADEILDINNKRHFYPFTTCTHCGPRYAITSHFPFERENTSLTAYTMCPACLNEYQTPDNKRFHAQTSTCPTCGITMVLRDVQGNGFPGNDESVFSILISKLDAGKIVAVKNTAGYLLLCDATNARAISELRNRKHRPDKPFAVLFKDSNHAGDYLLIREVEKEAMQSHVAPIVILPVKHKKDLATEVIAPKMDSIGAMLPNSGILVLLTQHFRKPLIATSANIHGSPLCATESAAERDLKDIADYFLHHSMEVLHPQDDSVIRFTHGTDTKIILRRARGLAPNSPSSGMESIGSQKILCLGGDLKSSVTIVPNNYCYTSEYIGDLGNYDTFIRYQQVIKSYQRIFNFRPDLILCDQHPSFESRKLIKEFPKAKVIAIQHHEAHFAAILQEHNLWQSTEQVMGIIWDGTGYGGRDDIWGGEFFTYIGNRINRVAHVEEYAWILGDKMAKTPGVSAVSISGGNPVLKKYFSETEWKIYTKCIGEKRIKTSSMGRLFDAVAFVLGFQQTISFEGEAAMYLEKLARGFHQNNPYFKAVDYLHDVQTHESIPVKAFFSSILAAQTQRTDPTEIAFNFHHTLVCCIKKMALHHQCRKLAFSGGVFQNGLLVDLTIQNLGSAFELYFHQQLSPNDENISFGQLCHYMHIAPEQIGF